MAHNRPWLVADSIVVLGAQHPEKLLPKFDPDNDVSPEDHIRQFMVSLRLMDVQHKDVVCRLFLHTFVRKASTWFFSLTAGSIASLQQFETTFLTQFRDDENYGVLFLEISRKSLTKRIR